MDRASNVMTGGTEQTPIRIFSENIRLSPGAPPKNCRRLWQPSYVKSLN